jgi:hypothetical protein
MQGRLGRLFALLLLAAGTLMPAACAGKRINDILADPSRYRNREVRVSGEVVDSYSFAGKGVYRIEDDTGRLWVMSTRGVPRKGARVTVKGTVREGLNLGSLGDRLPAEVASGLVLMESSHKARN